MSVFAHIRAYFFQGLCIVLLVLLATQTMRMYSAQLGRADAIATLNGERTAATARLAIAQASARESEKIMNTAAADIRKHANDQVRTLTNQRDALLNRVRLAEAASRAALSKAAADAGIGAPPPRDTGPEFLAPIGAADVDEAIRADTLRIELAACYKQYDDAREMMSQYE